MSEIEQKVKDILNRLGMDKVLDKVYQDYLIHDLSAQQVSDEIHRQLTIKEGKVTGFSDDTLASCRHGIGVKDYCEVCAMAYNPKPGWRG